MPRYFVILSHHLDWIKLFDSRFFSNSEGLRTPTYISAGKVGIGLTMEELVDLSQKMAPHWNRTRANQLPDGIVWTREKPDLWIAPENSYILQVSHIALQHWRKFQPFIFVVSVLELCCKKKKADSASSYLSIKKRVFFIYLQEHLLRHYYPLL